MTAILTNPDDGERIAWLQQGHAFRVNAQELPEGGRSAHGSRVWTAILVAASALVASTLHVAAASSGRQSVQGGWVGELPCAVTSVRPAPGLTTARATCVSGTTWDGAWTGHTRYVVSGTFHLLSGDFNGSIDETFTGVATADRSFGTLHLLGSITVYGATNTIVIDERIVGGTQNFTGTTGRVVFVGVQYSGVVGHGGYSGYWTRAHA